MKLVVLRYSDNGDSTLGLLFVDGKFECYILEDERREVKVAGETRIPAGRYQLMLRKHGGMHTRYQQRFDFHGGMVEIVDVPGFTDVLFHIGNDGDDTAGCLLCGDGVNNNSIGAGRVSDSTGAYKRVYQKILPALHRGAAAYIEIFDNPPPIHRNVFQ
jgi:hypothetical protein